MTDSYDPFVRGPFPAGVRTFQARDGARGREFPCEIWYPAADVHAGRDRSPDTQDTFTAPSVDEPRRQCAVRDAEARSGVFPLILYSHSSGRWNRRMATYLATHLASHGFHVAALDHSEVVAEELAPRADASAEQKAARQNAVIASRVPDVRFLLGHVLDGDWGALVDEAAIGIVGHSFGGWTALAAAGSEARIRAVTALAPAGASHPKPGILRVTLALDRGPHVPTLYLAGEDDTMTPLDGVRELFERTRARKRLFVLRRADHLHFMDGVEEEHEALRSMPLTGELAWIPKEMCPAGELVSGEAAHLFTRGLTLAHMDAVLGGRVDAERFLDGDVEGELARRGVEAFRYSSR